MSYHAGGKVAGRPGCALNELLWSMDHVTDAPRAVSWGVMEGL